MANYFELSARAIKMVTRSFQTFHGIWHETKCVGSLLEEIVYEALQMEAEPGDTVTWISDSHNPKADIVYTTKDFKLGLSIKSGTYVKGHPELIQLSGHRLGKAHGDMNLMNTILREQISDVVLCFIHNKSQRYYTLVYIDACVFNYPESSKGWQVTIGQKKGHIAEYYARSPEGLYTSIKPGLSYQTWWHIPVNICRPGPFFPYGYEREVSLSSRQGTLL